jgi:hypothetical protein
MDSTEIVKHPDLSLLEGNKLSAFEWRERRHDAWTEIYTLYRDTVIPNRLTQRQSVNLPLMKQTILTVLKDNDDMPVIYFENVDNNEEAQTFYNEYWNEVKRVNKLELKDIVDKRQVLLYGRSFTQINVVDGMVRFDIIDPQDMLVDRYCDPTDLDSARFIIHQHIFVPLASLEGNTDYDQKEIAKLKKWYGTQQGLVKLASNEQSLNEKNERMSQMGASDVDSPILGETYVELALHLVKQYDEKLKEDVIFLYTEAEGVALLKKETLEDCIGVTDDHYWRYHFNYESWADDVERTDFWSDGKGDVVRTPNKVLNSFYSQLIENRTLRNFNMHYYDATATGADNTQFSPGAYTPGPFKWFGLPGKPSEILQRADVPDLSESIDEMTFIMTMVERAAGSSATQQGAETQRQVTLGEVKLALDQAKQMTQTMSKFYTPSWYARAYKFIKICEAAGDKLDAVKIHKKGKNGKDIYSRTIDAKSWQTKSGFSVRVWSQEEKESQDASKLERLSATATIMADNPIMQRIYKEKLLEFADLPPEDVTAVMEYEQQKLDLQAQMAQAQSAAASMGAVPVDPMSAGGLAPVGGVPSDQGQGSIASQFQQFQQPAAQGATA